MGKMPQILTATREKVRLLKIHSTTPMFHYTLCRADGKMMLYPLGLLQGANTNALLTTHLWWCWCHNFTWGFGSKGFTLKSGFYLVQEHPDYTLMDKQQGASTQHRALPGTSRSLIYTAAFTDWIFLIQLKSHLSCQYRCSLVYFSVS